MQIIKINGNYVFEPSEWLSGSQIKFFFSRLTKKRRLSSQTKEQSETDESSEDDDESLIHASLMQQSSEILQQKETEALQQDLPSENSSSVIRKLNSRSNAELSTLQLTKRITRKLCFM